MADKAIIDLKPAEMLSPADIFLIQQYGEAKQASLELLLSVLSEIIGSENTIEITAAEIDEAYGRGTSGDFEIVDHRGY